MRQDVVGRKQPVTQVASAEEGLLVSLDPRRAVDLPLIATLYGKSEEQVTAALGDLVFQEPESRTWQTADQYLSGNVRAAEAVLKPAALRPKRRRSPESSPKTLPGDYS